MDQKTTPTYKIAIIQLAPKPGDAEDNFARAATYVRAAASQGAHLAVLPEYHLSGWTPDDPRFVQLAAPQAWRGYLERYCALARECRINIVPGTMLRREMDAADAPPGGERPALFNVAYFIDHDGNVLGSYKKKNLWHPERPHLQSGANDAHEVIQTPLGPVGLLVCWDLAFPEAFRELIAQGAKIIIIPSFWTLLDCGAVGLARNPRSEAICLTSTLTCRAFEQTCAVVFANAGGPAAEGAAGLSRLTVPFVGAVEPYMDSSAEAMVVADLDMAILDEAENIYRIRADITRDDWHYDYRPRSFQ